MMDDEEEKTMISDDERREVAKRLRELPSDTYAALKEWVMEGLFIDASIGDEADYSQIHNAVLGCFPAEHMHPGDYEELHERLADLIDRPTCKRLKNDRSYWRCSNCGAFVRWDAVTDLTGVRPASRCPNCGAEVVE